ncbi:MAG: carbon-nitrogen hydrolase family protein [Psychroserpens sp.]|nr:carbon-nitrogen hydrolase family protein [Psychroserpens sp.]
MRICIAQTKSKKGDLKENLQNHLRFIEHAIQLHSDVIIFPELSLTNYEPQLANDLAKDPNDPMFDPFQELADLNQITIGVGIPTRGMDGICISMLIFQPETARIVYSKRILHADELPYFVSGKQQPTMEIKNEVIALGICYETLQREHFIEAKENNADFYIASVSKPDKGTNHAYLHFPEIAKEFNTPILMSNAVGPSDDFISNGLSSVWDKNGELLGQLDSENQGLLIYDSDNEIIDIFYL